MISSNLPCSVRILVEVIVIFSLCWIMFANLYADKQQQQPAPKPRASTVPGITVYTQWPPFQFETEDSKVRYSII